MNCTVSENVGTWISLSLRILVPFFCLFFLFASVLVLCFTSILFHYFCRLFSLYVFWYQFTIDPVLKALKTLLLFNSTETSVFSGKSCKRQSRKTSPEASKQKKQSNIFRKIPSYIWLPSYNQRWINDCYRRYHHNHH